jgi:septum formation protein
MDRLVLASKSPRRREILERLGIPFIQWGMSIDETAHSGRTVRSSVMQLARKKAEAAFGCFSKGLIVGVDTVVHFNGRVLGKPVDESQAAAFLRMLSGNRHEVLSGVTVLNARTGKGRTSCSVSTVYFSVMSGTEIDRYVRSGEWTDKAGGYAVQGKAALFIRRIEGSYYNIMGLPVEELYRLLKSFSYFETAGLYEPRRRVPSL